MLYIQLLTNYQDLWERSQKGQSVFVVRHLGSFFFSTFYLFICLFYCLHCVKLGSDVREVKTGSKVFFFTIIFQLKQSWMDSYLKLYECTQLYRWLQVVLTLNTTKHACETGSFLRFYSVIVFYQMIYIFNNLFMKKGQCTHCWIGAKHFKIRKFMENLIKIVLHLSIHLSIFIQAKKETIISQ